MRYKRTFIFLLLGLVFSQEMYAQLVVGFKMDKASYCIGTEATFTDNSFYGSLPLDPSLNPIYSWTFDNKVDLPTKIPNLKNPKYPFPKSGIWYVTYEVEYKGDKSSTQGVVFVAEPPKVDIGIPSAECQPFNAKITDLTKPYSAVDNTNKNYSDKIVTWSWEYGDGNSEDNLNVNFTNHIYNDDPNNTNGFQVRLTLLTEAGCKVTDVAKQSLTVLPSIQPDFNFQSFYPACEMPVKINPTNVVLGSLQYFWSVDGGATISNSSNQVPDFTFTSPGTYKITLNVKNSSGCMGIAKSTTTVISPPANTLDFTVPAGNKLCANTNYIFKSITNNSATDFEWYIGNSTTSAGNTNSISKNFTSASSPVTITLFAKFIGGCRISATHTIVIASTPTPDFNAINRSSCTIPFTVNFNDNSSPDVVKSEFDFGDNSTTTYSPPASTLTHTYTKAGSFTVSLKVTNSDGCTAITSNILNKDYIKIQIPVIVSPPKSLITSLPDSGCLGKPLTPMVEFDASSGIGTWDWKVTDPNGNILYNGNAQFPPTIPSSQMNQSGVYKVALNVTTTLGCTASPFLFNVSRGTQPAQPTISNSLSSVCAVNQNVNFSTNIIPGVTAYKWEFSDNPQPYNMVNVQRAFSTLGIVNVKLTNYIYGCASISSTTSISVGGAIANYQVLNDCNIPLVRKIINKSQVASSLQSEVWDIDGNIQSGPLSTINYTFTTSGAKTITLTVKDAASGCQDQKTQVIYISNEKNITFNTSKPILCVADQQVNLVANPENPDMISKYDWDIGCGSVSLPTNTYTLDFSKLCNYSGNNGRGTYTFNLTVWDKNNCPYKAAQQKDIIIGGPVSNYKNLTTLSGCKNLSVLFQNQSTSDGISPIVKNNWDFGDNTGIQPYSSGPIEHIFSTAGTYSVTLTTEDARGCQSSISTLVVNTSNPIIDFSGPTKSCPGAPVDFQLSTSSSLKNIFWDLGDGIIPPANSNSVSATYLQPGFKDISLKVEDFFGCKVDVYKSNYVLIDKPFASFSSLTNVSDCYPFVAEFKFTGSYAESFKWDFGDGGQAFTEEPSHVYLQPGIFNVNLSVRSPGGCSSSYGPFTINVFGPTGKANFQNYVCDPDYKTAINIVSSDASKVLINYGDGISEILPFKTQPYFHNYTSDGFYQPQIFISDAKGCTVPLQMNNGIKAVNILPVFKPDVNFYCERGSVKFTDLTLSNDPLSAWNWDFGDNTPAGSGATTNHYYTKPGLYNVSMTVTSQSGCKKTLTKDKLIEIQARPDIDIISSKAKLCEDDMIQFEAKEITTNNSPVIKWFWDFTNGQSSDQQMPPLQQFRKAGVYNFRLYVTNDKGCSDTLEKKFDVFATPKLEAGLDTFLCLNTPIKLVPSGADKYFWTTDPTLNVSSPASPIVNTSIDKTYYVTGSSLEGCIAQDSIRVHVVKPSSVDAPADLTICIGESVTLKATGAEFYSWTPQTGISNPAKASITVKPDETTTYVVTGKDSYGCFVTTDKVVVKVDPLPTIDAGKDTTIMAGYPYMIKPDYSSDVTKVQWVPSLFLDCTDCKTPVSTPMNSVTYTVLAYTANGCMSKDVINIYATCSKENIFVPNTFSPNGDGMNEVFYPRGRGIQKIKSMKIFSRWGELLFIKENFYANDINMGWNGKKGGTAVSPDVYVYMLDLVCENGNIITLKGDVTLVR